MKKLIIILVLLILLLAGTAGGLAMLKIGPFAKLLPPEMTGGDKPKEAAAEAPPPSNDVYYDVGAYIIPVVEDRAINRQVGIDLAIAVNPKDAPRISGALPRLQDAFTTELFRIIPRYHDSKSASDRQAIHDHLLKVATKMFGGEAVRDVLVKSIYDR